MAKSVTPELDKQSEIIQSGQAEVVQEFIDWLHAQGFRLCLPVPNSRHGYYGVHPLDGNPEQLMADFFGINLTKIEQERRWILANMRKETPVD